ncbi:15240_t:CDS:2, partial [Acaulospora colombiana]
MPRNEQTKSSTLRSRQRITNKTRLRVVHGSIDAETVTIGEDDGRGALHSTQGVEAEDAAEHHLQQVLNAANNSANNQQRSQRPSTGDAATQTASATLQPPQEAHFIPTPDAQGVVGNYDDLYVPNSHEMPYAILMFSDTVEECRTYGLAGRSYTMDEQDAAWLEKWNKQARGEGTSYSTTRRSRNKASEAEEEPQLVITEDWFELCMGMFEKFASEHYPYLHVDSSCPPFSFFQPLFQMPYTPSLFASSLIPDGLPDPSELAQMAKGIYPHWAERKGERKGRSIIPDVNLDEADEGNVYVCFRRREIKPIRKTRRMETTSIDKLTRLSVEFQSALQLATRAIEREEAKKELCDMDQVVWTWRTQLVSITSKFPDLRNPDDDKWLVDKEKVKKLKTPGSLYVLLLYPSTPTISFAISTDHQLPFPKVPPIPVNSMTFLILDRRKFIQEKGIEISSTRSNKTSKEKETKMFWDGRMLQMLQKTCPSSVQVDRQRSGIVLEEEVAAISTVEIHLSHHHPLQPALMSKLLPETLSLLPWIGFPHATQPTAENNDEATSSDEVDVELVKRLEERCKFDTDLVSATKPPVRTVIDDFDHR